MTLTRFNQTQGRVRSVLYFPAYLHEDRLGGAVLMGNSAANPSNIEVLQISTQILLANLRLVEFPEEIQRAEKEVVQRQLVRRFRHNLLHPLGEVMDATRRFKESFEQILAVFDKGIESWKPDLMPNYVKKFLTYIAGEYNTKADSAGEEEDRRISDSDETGRRFKVDVDGDEHVDRFDRTILAEVLGNLFTNTRRYAAPKPGFKGVRLTAGKAAGDQIVYEEIGGPGLPPGVAGDPWRLHPRDATVDASSGQGLFMAKRLMDIHGGKLSYEPSQFGGCCFKIDLREDADAQAERS
jgi:K+-sensing histidine kinase KdpD